MSDKMFPILRDDVLKAIPWALISGHEQQAQKNHYQSLSMLAARGGLSPEEAFAVIAGKPFQTIPRGYARAWLLAEAWRLERPDPKVSHE